MYDTSQQPEMMRERYPELPDEVKELFEYGIVEQMLQKVNQEFGLREDDIPLLQMEVDLILYGFLTRDGLSTRLQESLSIEESRARQIAERLEGDLFIIVDRYLTYVEELLTESINEEKPLIANQSQTEEGPTQVSKPADAIVDNHGESVISTPAKEVPKETKQSTEGNIKPLRTFAEDVELSRVHGYGTFQSGEVTEDTDDTPVHRSNQDDIIKK